MNPQSLFLVDASLIAPRLPIYEDQVICQKYLEEHNFIINPH